MRCLSCAKVMTDYEATIKYSNPELGYTDLCSKCLGTIEADINVVKRDDLAAKSANQLKRKRNATTG